MVSTVIITKNEEIDLPQCLNALHWCDDIHVLDSFSTDNTVAIASRFGAHVSQKTFEGYASQRNAALALRLKHRWVLFLDADERIPPLLVKEIHEQIQCVSSDVAAFRLQRRDFLYGRWLKHAQISPYYVRLLRADRCHYEREVNEVVRVDGIIQNLSEPFDHFPFSKGMSHWIEKHNRYSSMEAARWHEEQISEAPFSLKSALFSFDFNERRYHQKGLFYRLPARPLVKWMYMMFWRGAIRDGKAGFTYASLQCIYEYMIVLKAFELRHLGSKRQSNP